MPDLAYKVNAERTGPSCVSVTTRDFCFQVDEPESLGGKNAAPNPVDYLLGAYAGCLNVMGNMIANEMGIKIDSLKIDIEGKLDPAGFLGTDPAVRPGLKEINVTLNVESSADQEDMEDWLEAINDRGPIGDNLKNPTPITTKMNILEMVKG